MITSEIREQIIKAMKARDSVRLSTLKMLSSELHNAAIDNHGELSGEQELVVVKKEAKKRKDAIEAYETAGQAQRAESERAELEILQEFMPEELSDDDLEKIVAEAILESGATGMVDMGKAMGAAMARTKGQADGNRVSALVKAKLLQNG